jgi:hypothetical protein
MFQKICKRHHFGTGITDTQFASIKWLEGGNRKIPESRKAEVSFGKREPSPLFTGTCGGFRDRQQFDKPCLLGIGIYLRWIEANSRKLVYRCMLVAGALMIALRPPLPTCI